MLSVHDDDARIVAAVQAGACGYILKDADHQEFLRIIRATFRGEPVRSPSCRTGLPKKPWRWRNKQDESGVRGLTILTDREREIIRRRRDGATKTSLINSAYPLIR